MSFVISHAVLAWLPSDDQKNKKAYNAAMPAMSDFDVEGLAAQLTAWGLNPAHAGRLMRLFYASHGQIDFSTLDVTTFGKAVREKMVSEIPPRRSTLITHHRSDDGTEKLLIGLTRGGAVETVLMPWYHIHRAAGCISSQIGCAMGCDFCASTKRGLERNLEAGEIIEQYLHLRHAAAAVGRRVSSLVFMGMGEPMHNLDHVITAIRRITDQALGSLGSRQITVSTVGIVPGIDRLIDEDLNVHLAVSLHAPDEATRARLIPANRRWGIADIMAAARRFEARTGRIPTLEYTMLDGVNDSDEQARMLADLMNGFRAHVNLIPYNAIGPGVSGVVYRQPPAERMNAFLKILRDRRVVAHFRRTRGDDVNAACGQLRETQTMVG